MDFKRPEERLRAAREAAGFVTAASFADSHDIKRATYSAHERGPEAGGNGMLRAVGERYAAILRRWFPEFSAEWLLYGAGPSPLPGGDAAQDAVREPKPVELREPEAALYEGPLPASSQFIVNALAPGRANAFVYQIRGRALDLDGILDGDLVIADLAGAPMPGDHVIAQVYDWQKGSADSIVRRFQPPYLLAHSTAANPPAPIRTDDTAVAIKARIVAVFRCPAASV